MPNRYLARVYVRLKPGYSDPEGETTARALRGLGYNVEDVRVSKVYEILFEAEGRSEAGELVEEMCRRLLTNPTKDDYTYELREME
ncbi:phosphoribosylformylglycinamidine synthase subunit PurS [Candidatus Bathyarchaeota archaeon]|nr:phosphoribosylformylglycinamidine synthase subunit PurS [Candidatus Bathyarchaeota archaeon]